MSHVKAKIHQIRFLASVHLSVCLCQMELDTNDTVSRDRAYPNVGRRSQTQHIIDAAVRHGPTDGQPDSRCQKSLTHPDVGLEHRSTDPTSAAPRGPDRAAVDVA